MPFFYGLTDFNIYHLLQLFLHESQRVNFWRYLYRPTTFFQQPPAAAIDGHFDCILGLSSQGSSQEKVNENPSVNTEH